MNMSLLSTIGMLLIQGGGAGNDIQEIYVVISLS